MILAYHGFQLIGSQISLGRPWGLDVPWPRANNPFLAVVVEGHSAVSLFIVLSGFILSHGVLSRDIDYRGFLLARCLRIYPMMILCLVMAIAVAAADLATIINSIVPVDSRSGIVSPFTAMFWAVKIELQCYLLFPAMLWMMKTRGIKVLLFIVLLAFVLRVAAVLGAGASARDVSYWTLVGRVDQFVIGMMAAKLFKDHGAKISPLWFVPSAIIAVAMLVVLNRLGGWPTQASWRTAFPPIEAFVWAAFIVTYLIVGKFLHRKVSALIAALGAVSYSAYLLHYVIIEAVIKQKAFLTFTGRADWDAIVTSLAIVFPITTLIATLTYHLVEKPFMAIRPKYAH